MKKSAQKVTTAVVVTHSHYWVPEPHPVYPTPTPGSPVDPTDKIKVKPKKSRPRKRAAMSYTEYYARLFPSA